MIDVFGLFILGACSVFAGGFMTGVLYGYMRGVKETEARWSEAVQRAEAKQWDLDTRR